MPGESPPGSRAGGAPSSARGVEDGGHARELGDAADSFQRLGNEQRLAVLARLAEDSPQSFSALAADSEADSSAGFAYHLRQLDDQFVRTREDDDYELTAAGRDVVRTIRTDALTDRPDTAMDLDVACPLCGDTALGLATSDGVATVSCAHCDGAVLNLPVPPGADTRPDERVPDALDSYHRNRISTFADGVCPDCGGAVDVTVDTAADGDHAGPAQATFECECCERRFRCPATLTVLDHPAVVSFYADHDEPLAERPLWNVGPEWRDRLVSRDPWCLLVSSRLDDELLALYLGPDTSVHEWRRRPVPADARESVEKREDVAA